MSAPFFRPVIDSRDPPDEAARIARLEADVANLRRELARTSALMLDIARDHLDHVAPLPEAPAPAVPRVTQTLRRWREVRDVPCRVSSRAVDVTGSLMGDPPPGRSALDGMRRHG